MLKAIQLLVAPVVMISAGGLISLALYNRLAAIVSRARTFHKERFDAVNRLPAANEPTAARLRRRIELLDQQVDRILSRGRILRLSLACLLTMVLCMLGCSLALGLTIIAPAAAAAALALFGLGVIVMAAAIALAIVELFHALDPVEMEQHAIDEEAGAHT